MAAGDPQHVGDRYLDLNFSQEAREQAVSSEGTGTEISDSHGDGRAVIERAWFSLPDGEEATTLPNGKRTTFTMQVRFVEQVENPVFGLTLRSSAAIPLLTIASDWGSTPAGVFQAGESVLWKTTFDNVLGPDRYGVTPSVTLGGGAVLALKERMATVVVTRSAPTGALIDIPFEQEIERDTPLDIAQEVIR